MTTLTRMDAEKNMARFYHMEILPDLFGGVQLIRQWGRIGDKGGQELREHYADASLAQAKFDDMRNQKMKRGYAIKCDDLRQRAR